MYPSDAQQAERRILSQSWYGEIHCLHSERTSVTDFLQPLSEHGYTPLVPAGCANKGPNRAAVLCAIMMRPESPLSRLALGPRVSHAPLARTGVTFFGVPRNQEEGFRNEFRELV